MSGNALYYLAEEEGLEPPSPEGSGFQDRRITIILFLQDAGIKYVRLRIEGNNRRSQAAAPNSR